MMTQSSLSSMSIGPNWKQAASLSGWGYDPITKQVSYSSVIVKINNEIIKSFIVSTIQKHPPEEAVLNSKQNIIDELHKILAAQHLPIELIRRAINGLIGERKPEAANPGNNEDVSNKLQESWDVSVKYGALSYKGRVLNHLHHNHISANQFAFMKALIEAYPQAVSQEVLMEHAYGPSETGPDPARRLYSGITTFRNTFLEHFPEAEDPVHYIEPFKAFALNIPLDEITPAAASLMGLQKYGPLSIATHSARIWVDSMPMTRMGTLVWATALEFIKNKDRVMTSSDMAKAIYGDDAPNHIDLVHKGVRYLRDNINEISPALGDYMVTNQRGVGYRLNVPTHWPLIYGLDDQRQPKPLP